MKTNYFKIYRTLLESELWLKEPFTRGQAWVDLIGLANYSTKESFYKGELQIVKRGQIQASYGFFVKRWKWSRNKVLHYFKQLSVLQMVSVTSTRYGTTITLENYESFQGQGTSKGTTEGTSKGIPEGIPEGIQKKKEKKEKKEKGVIVKSEVIDGFLIETDEFGREFAEKL